MPEKMLFHFEKNTRYRVIFLPAGARTKTREFVGNYLGPNRLESGVHDFDGRPASGTVSIREDQIHAFEKVGPAVWAD